MVKIPYKVLTLSTLIAFSTMQHAMPIQAIAAEKTAQTEQSQKYKDPLGPADMKQALAETGSHMLLMDIYANTIIKQPLIDFKQIPFENKDKLVSSIHQNQKQSLGNANKWTNNLKPQIIKVNQLTLDYQVKFESYYKILSEYLDQSNKSGFKGGLKTLTTTLSKNKNQITKVIENLTDFQTALMVDNQGFNSDAQQLEAALAGQDAMIPQLNKELENLNKTLQDHWNKVTYSGLGLGLAIVGGLTFIAIGGAIVVLTGGLALPAAAALGTGVALSIAGTAGATYMLTNNLSAIGTLNENIRILTEQKNSAQQASIGMTSAKNQVNNLAQTIGLAITSLTKLKNQWGTMEARYTGLLADADDFSIESLKEDLETAHAGWDDLYQLAEKMKEDIDHASK